MLTLSFLLIFVGSKMKQKVNILAETFREFLKDGILENKKSDFVKGLIYITKNLHKGGF